MKKNITIKFWVQTLTYIIYNILIIGMILLFCLPEAGKKEADIINLVGFFALIAIWLAGLAILIWVLNSLRAIRFDGKNIKTKNLGKENPAINIDCSEIIDAKYIKDGMIQSYLKLLTKEKTYKLLVGFFTKAQIEEIINEIKLRGGLKGFEAPTTHAHTNKIKHINEHPWILGLHLVIDAAVIFGAQLGICAAFNLFSHAGWLIITVVFAGAIYLGEIVFDIVFLRSMVAFDDEKMYYKLRTKSIACKEVIDFEFKKSFLTTAVVLKTKEKEIKIKRTFFLKSKAIEILNEIQKRGGLKNKEIEIN